MFGTQSVTVRLGATVALDNVSIQLRPGEVSTVVGGDGAGKSTLLRALSGSVPVTSGGLQVPPRQQIGLLPASAGSWSSLTVVQNLDFAATAYRTSDDGWRAQLLSRAGLTAVQGRLASALSGGMRRKLGVIMALVGKPQLLLLDEPSTGVDPVSRVELWRLISQAAAEGAAVLTTTTYLDEAERASQVLALDAGNELVRGDPAVLKQEFPGAFWATEHRAAGFAWRRGRSWHHWAPELPATKRRIEPDLHDVVVAAALQKEQA